jgi:Domain of unknown function DUF11
MSRCYPLLVALFVLSFIVFLRADVLLNFSLPEAGGVSFTSQNPGAPRGTGYARIRPTAPSPVSPVAFAIFGFRQAGVLVSEAGVPSSEPVRSGRIYAEVSSTVNTGIAIANPNNQPVTVMFYFSDTNRQSFGSGSTIIPANGQIAAYLNQAPFNLGTFINGTFTFASDVPVAVIALRGYTNQRSEFLITTLPVADLIAETGTLVFPHFANGGGWSTQVILVNPSESTIGGMVRFYSQGSTGSAGQSVNVSVNGQTSTQFPYLIPPRASVRFQTSSAETTIQSGSVRVIPDDNILAPSGLVIFSYTNRGVTVSEAGIASSPTSADHRLYVEVSDPATAILSGLALANPSETTVEVSLDLTTLDGADAAQTATIRLPANGQTAKFLTEIFPDLPRPFKGVLEVSTTSSPIAVIGLRSRRNERQDFLITTTPAVDESLPPSDEEVVVPHIVVGGGYITQVVLFSGTPGVPSGGSIQFFNQSGLAMDFNIGTHADVRVQQVGPPSCSFSGGACNNIRFDIRVMNDGPDVASGVIFTDILPTDRTTGALITDLVSVSASQTNCTRPATAIITCSLGSLSVGDQGSRLISLNLSVNPTATGAVVRNSARVASSAIDTNTSNNAHDLGFAALPIIVPPPDLQLVALSATDPVWVGYNLAYKTTIQNLGPGPALQVRVTNRIAATGSMIFIPDLSSRGCQSGRPGEFVCSIDSLPKNTKVTVTVVFRPTSIGAITNTVTVAGDPARPDTNPANNSATVTKNAVRRPIITIPAPFPSPPIASR